MSASGLRGSKTTDGVLNGAANSESADTNTITTLEDLPLMLTVEETARVLRIGRNGAYAAVAQGDLPAVRIGRNIRIPRMALATLLGVAAGDRPFDVQDRDGGPAQDLGQRRSRLT